MRHAWVETDDGRVYDPTYNQYFPLEQYLAEQQAVAMYRYSQAEARRHMIETRHHGPWEGPGSIGPQQRENWK
jgi:hypothetical protein